MIVFETPLIIYPNEYNGQFFVRCEIEWRTQSVTLYLAPAQTDQQHIYLGVKETVDGVVQLRFPEMIRAVTITQNLDNPDPAIRLLFQKLVAFLEDAEKIVVENQHEPGGLATIPYQMGTTEWSLASTYTPTGGRDIGVKDVTPPPAED